MAGNFVDVPSNRMVLDKDGSQFYLINSDKVVSQLTSTMVQQICNENLDAAAGGAIPGSNNGGGMESLAVLFPEKRDLAAWYGVFSSLGSAPISGSGTDISVVEVSTNTTNGLDGTWSQLDVLTTPSPLSMLPEYRTSIRTAAALGIQGVRFRAYKSWDLNVHTVHLYGNISPGQNVHRLAIWHPTLDQQVGGAYFDWGNVPRSSSEDRNFRVKNLSPDRTAQTIQLGFDALSDGSPSLAGQHLLSSDGATWTSTLTIGDLAPSSLSALVRMRRNTPTNAQLGIWALRVAATAQNWV